jgi:hypothetical protein
MPHYLKLLAFVFVYKITKIFLCSLLVPKIKFLSLLDVQQQDMVFVKMLTYLIHSLNSLPD